MASFCSDSTLSPLAWRGSTFSLESPTAAQFDVKRSDSGLTMHDCSSPSSESPLSKLIQLHQHFAEKGKPDAGLFEPQRGAAEELSANPVMIDPPLKDRIHPFKDRIKDLEDGLDSVCGRQAECSRDLKNLQARLIDDVCPKLESLSRLLGQGTDSRDQLASLPERIDAIERRCQDASTLHGKHSEQMEILMQSHDSLADEIKQRYLHQMSFIERLDAIETAVGSAFDAHSNEFGSMKSKLEALERRTEEACTSMEASASALDLRHADLEHHLELVEAALGDAANRQTRQIEFVQSSYARLADEVKSREKKHAELDVMLSQHLEIEQRAAAERSSRGGRLDQLEAAAQRSAAAQAGFDGLAARLDQLTRVVDDSISRTSGDSSSMLEKIRRLQNELEAEADARKRAVTEVSDRCLVAAEGRTQKLSEELFALTAANARLASDLQSSRLPLEEASSIAKKRIDDLEDRVRQLGATTACVGAVERKVEEFSEVYVKLSRQEEILAALKTELGKLHGRSEEKHQGMGEALAKSIREVQQRTDEVEVLMRKLEGDLPARLQEFRQPLQQRVDEVDAALQEVEARRAKDVEALQDKFKAAEASRAAENCSMRDSIVQATVEDERRWQQVLEQLAVERAAKDKHQEHVMGLFDQEKEARARQLEITPAFRDLNEALRQRIEELQRSVHALESMFRKDLQDRAQESASLWSAIDSQQSEQKQILESQSFSVTGIARGVSGGDDAGGSRKRSPQYKGHALMSFITQEGYGAGPDLPKEPQTGPKKICEQLQALEPKRVGDAKA